MTKDLLTGIDLAESHPAARLAARIEVISEDLQAPVEISYRLHDGTTEVATVCLTSLLSDAHFAARDTEANTAIAIAEQFEAWSKRFTAVAGEIRQRFQSRV